MAKTIMIVEDNELNMKLFNLFKKIGRGLHLKYQKARLRWNPSLKIDVG